ncbi:TonB-dependent receptor [Pseudothauera rhizosphaerae]|uniref:TonB-dependent receptor n=1 Tax=Pseudothauera rhizosphaerae TaxID=2565932 RepID=A0A4V3WBA9_9RHOO|nr:TonB-dependent receptor [Pseudothauera rhizosphaerae]THF62587.1 TonB-dependent receptor [Pseudothauera rhizosphaerae]
MHCLRPVMAALLLLPVVSTAHADGPRVLSELVVHPEGFTEQERETATSAFTITEETIKRSSAQNLSELLIEQGFSVEATPTDHGENTTLIRGFHTEHLMTEANGKLLILIDGRRSGVANTRQISLNNVERVEVLRGPEMFKYSMGSPGGIINVVTRRGGPEYFSGSARIGLGSYDAYRAGVDLNGRAGRFDYTFGYEHGTVRRDYKDGRGDKVHNTRTDATERLNFNLGYTFNERHRIGIDGYHYNVDKAHRPSYVDEEGEIRNNSYTDRKTQLLYLNYEGATEDGRLSWKANVGQGKDIYETYDAASRYPKGQEADTDRAQGSLTYVSTLFDVTGGVDYIKYELENSSTARSNFLRPGGLDPQWAGLGYPMHPTSTTTLWGAYMVGTLKLQDGALNLSGGLRYEHASAKDLSVGDEHYDRVPYFTSRGITSRDQLPARRSFHHVSPTVGVSWLPVDGLKLRANYTQGWRAPSGRQLFASSFYEDYGAPGDPRLKPEFTDAYEIGFDLARTDWRLSGTYFYYEIKDNVYIYPGVRPGGGTPQGRVVMNVDRRIQEGVEIQASADVAGLLGYRSVELRPYLNVTHMTRKKEVIDEGGPGLLGKWWPIARMPDTTASYGIRFSHPASKFSGNLNFSFYGKQYGGRSNVGDGPLVGFGNFTVANLSLRKRLWEAGERSSVDLKVDINNLFDETYSYLGRIPQDAYAYPGRNLHATLIYNF